MIDWLLALTPLFKFVHIAALCLWCGALLAMPLMLSRHSPQLDQNQYGRLRYATHVTYTLVVTPAAVIAVIAGTWLIFMREAFVPWLYAKLACVAFLVLAHAWIGHLMVKVAEAPKESTPPNPVLPIILLLTPMLLILLLVLGKPQLSAVDFPGWLLEPQDGQLPFAVPKR